MRLAIAAAVLIAATIGAWTWLGSGGPTTFEQVRVATEKMPWMHVVVRSAIRTARPVPCSTGTTSRPS